jgi:hypothetical protein
MVVGRADRDPQGHAAGRAGERFAPAAGRSHTPPQAGVQPEFEALWCAPAAQDLLERAARELRAAEVAGDPGDRFLHSHLAALRTAGAVIAVRGRPAARGRARTAWEILARVAPECRGWASYFAAGADLRAALESGRRSEVSQARADHVLSMARMFLGAVHDLSLARAS